MKAPRPPIEPGDPRYKAVYHDPDCLLKSIEVSKSFGEKQALRDVSVEVRRGDLFGLVGSNGAGKTTLLRIATSLLWPTSGSMYVAGHSVRIWARGVKRQIGYMPDSLGLEERVRAHVYLAFFALLLKIPVGERAGRVQEALEEVGLWERRHAEVRELSRGMQQRLAVARLLLQKPRLLLLDEPLSGLDPRGRVEILELLRRLNGAGQTVVISSHVLYDLERFCNRLAILEEGRVQFAGTTAAARKAVEPRLRHVVSVAGGRGAEALERLGQMEEVSDAVQDGAVSGAGAGRGARLCFRLRPPSVDAGAVVARLVTDGFRLLEVGREEASLHDVYLHFTEGKVS